MTLASSSSCAGATPAADRCSTRRTGSANADFHLAREKRAAELLRPDRRGERRMKLCTNEMMYCLKVGGGFPDTELVIGGAVGMAESRGETDATGRLAGADRILDDEDLGWLMISTHVARAKVTDLVGAQLARPVRQRRSLAPSSRSSWASPAEAGPRGRLHLEELREVATDGPLRALHPWAPSPTGDYTVRIRDLATK